MNGNAKIAESSIFRGNKVIIIGVKSYHAAGLIQNIKSMNNFEPMTEFELQTKHVGFVMRDMDRVIIVRLPATKLVA